MYGVSRQMSEDSSYEQASVPAGHGSDISPELREVLHMLEVFEHKPPAGAVKR